MKKQEFVDVLEMEEESWNECDRLTDGGTATEEKPAADAKPAGEKEDPAADKGDDPDKEKPAEKMVPVSAVTAERDKRQQAENNFSLLQQQVALTMQNQQNQPAKPASAIDSMDDEAIVNGRDVKKMFDQLVTEFSSKLNTIDSTNRASNAILLTKSNNNDYEDVIKNNLVNVLDANPGFREGLATVAKEYQPLLAYAIGTLDPEYIKKANAGTTRDIQEKIKENAKKPGSVNAAGGAADTSDLATIIASESQEDFNKRVARIKAQA
jgi:hypothetical protein